MPRRKSNARQQFNSKQPTGRMSRLAHKLKKEAQATRGKLPPVSPGLRVAAEG